MDDVNEIKLGGTIDRKPFTGSSPKSGDRYCFFTLQHVSQGRKIFIKCSMNGEFDAPEANSRIVVTGRLMNTKTKNKDGTEVWEKGIAVESWKDSSEEIVQAQSALADSLNTDDVPW